MTTDPRPFPTAEQIEQGRALLRSSKFDLSEPRLDYLTAKHLIIAILAMVPDDEFEDALEITTSEDGITVAKAPEGDIGYGIGCTTAIDADGERPVMANYREHAAEQALDLEAVHRVEVAHWANGGAPARKHMRTLKEFYAENGQQETPQPRLKSVDRLIDEQLRAELSEVFAKDVIQGRVIHNVETDMFVASNVATDADRADAAAAYARMLAAKDALGGAE